MTIDFTTREGRRAQGRLIQQAAEEAGLSLEALAREIECSRALIYQYVSGATLAQPDRIQLIAQRTGKPLLYFYGGDATPDNLLERVQGLLTLLTAQLAPPTPPAPCPPPNSSSPSRGRRGTCARRPGRGCASSPCCWAAGMRRGR